MSARATAGGLVASGAILAIAWGLGSGGTATSSPSTVAAGEGTSSSTSTSTSSSGSSSAMGGSAADGTYTGTTVSTRFGDVQVQVTISGGSITDVLALHLTDRDGKSIAISNRAAPILRDRVLSAQSADVGTVSGATYTSEGYLMSLQSALDQAGL